LHGISAVKVLVILWLNYQIATALPKQYVTATTWIFNIALLFANELCRGYRFADILAIALPPQTTNVDVKPTSEYGAWLDSYGGLIPRWEVLFNITVLRLIAFNLDHLWMTDRRASSPIEVLKQQVLLPYVTRLIHSRRRTSIPPPSPNVTVSRSALTLSTTRSPTTSPTSSTHPFT
jgi:hypothetical protein